MEGVDVHKVRVRLQRHQPIFQENLLDVLRDPGRLLDLFKVSQDRGLTIDGRTLEEIHRHMETVSDEAICTPSASQALSLIHI